MSAVDTDVIHLASAEDMQDVSDNSVALTVTSPPYWNAIDYNVHAENPEAWYRNREYDKEYQKYHEYLDWLRRIYSEIHKKTRPGGFCATVIGTVLLDGAHYPLPFHFVSLAEEIGWLFHQDIIWHKVTGGVKRAGSFIQHPEPGYFYPNIMTEYIIILRRPGPPIYEAAVESPRIDINEAFKKEIANTVWHIAPVPPGHLDHPCPFPEEIPFRLIMLYSNPGDVVLDPFVGSGQTLKVAHYLGRKYVGYEIEPKYVEYARKRIDEAPALRKEQLVAVFDKMRSNLQYEDANVLRPVARRKQGALFR